MNTQPARTALAAVAACVAASVAWLVAFALGARLGALYPLLGTVAAGIAVTCLALSPALRAQLRPRLAHVAAGALLGGASLVLTHLAFPLAARLLPALHVEVARLYAVASITPAALGAVALIVLAEELLWRGALPRALARHVSPFEAALLATGAYTAAQLGAGSGLLALAALGLGGVWMACAHVSRGLVVSVVSHAVWTLGVLGFWPLPLTG